MEISDAARAVTELYRFSDLHEGECRVVNVASEDTRTLREFVEEIHRICGEKGSLSTVLLCRQRKELCRSALWFGS